MKVVHFEISLCGIHVRRFHLMTYDTNEHGSTSEVVLGFSNDFTTDKPPAEINMVNKHSTNNCNKSHDIVKLAASESKDGATYISTPHKGILKDGKIDCNYKILLCNNEITGCCNCLKFCGTPKITIETSELFVILFYISLYRFQSYRNYVFNNFMNSRKYSKFMHNENQTNNVVNILIPSYGDNNVIDYKWNDLIQHLCLQKKELDSAMSWLSTLGGACSALGDENEYFAKMAGQISLKQFSLAIKLGDELTVARCKLYYALSLIQKGLLKSANRIIKQQYCFAMNKKAKDNKLISMCLGIHAKLRYEYNKRKHKKCGITKYYIAK